MKIPGGNNGWMSRENAIEFQRELLEEIAREEAAAEKRKKSLAKLSSKPTKIPKPKKIGIASSPVKGKKLVNSPSPMISFSPSVKNAVFIKDINTSILNKKLPNIFDKRNDKNNNVSARIARLKRMIENYNIARLERQMKDLNKATNRLKHQAASWNATRNIMPNENGNIFYNALNHQNWLNNNNKAKSKKSKKSS